MPKIVGQSLQIRQLREMCCKLADFPVSVVVHGESGTGKELIARSIHESGQRALKPFVVVDCAALTPTLAESELFGHTRGAFTGAIDDHDGLLIAAGGGTLFLDEISELPKSIQPKLLRALQQKEVRPVGSVRSRRFHARIVAATNVDLEEAVRTGEFRRDLFFRLNVVMLAVSPLREHKEDIPLLVEHFLRQYPDCAGVRLSAAAMDRLMSHTWPGNVRELENCVARELCLRTNDTLTFELLEAEHTALDAVALTLREVENKAIRNALASSGGSVEAVARKLNIGRSTVYRKLKLMEPG